MRLVYIAAAALVVSCTCIDAFATAAKSKADIEPDVARVDGAADDHVDKADTERLTKAAEAQGDPLALRPEDEARNVGGGMKNLLVKGVDSTAGKAVDLVMLAAVRAQSRKKMLSMADPNKIDKPRRMLDPVWKAAAKNPTLKKINGKGANAVNKIKNLKIGRASVRDRYKMAQFKTYFKKGLTPNDFKFLKSIKKAKPTTRDELVRQYSVYYAGRQGKAARKKAAKSDAANIKIARAAVRKREKVDAAAEAADRKGAAAAAARNAAAVA
ncbi:unnamed protein product [Hyaloperonospora brassicae]|uniref:RxLR effector protein n=1 Tax=Hyaloperonospora brassicae TaxID=162125 RepID=A0AAV0TKU9_HYABA|nr:unnamed protein product [Hyaloperonospora brassicae]